MNLHFCWHIKTPRALGPHLQEITKDTAHILLSIQSSIVNLTGESITGNAVDILLAGTAIIFSLVSIPTGLLSSLLSVAKVCWQVCKKLFHKFSDPVKDL